MKQLHECQRTAPRYLKGGQAETGWVNVSPHLWLKTQMQQRSLHSVIFPEEWNDCSTKTKICRSQRSNLKFWDSFRPATSKLLFLWHPPSQRHHNAAFFISIETPFSIRPWLSTTTICLIYLKYPRQNKGQSNCQKNPLISKSLAMQKLFPVDATDGAREKLWSLIRTDWKLSVASVLGRIESQD